MPSESVLSVDRMVLELTPYEESLVRAAFIYRTDKLRTNRPYRMTASSTAFDAAANYVWQKFYLGFADSQLYRCRATYAGWFLSNNDAGRQKKKSTLDKLVLRATSVLTPAMRERIRHWTWGSGHYMCKE